MTITLVGDSPCGDFVLHPDMSYMYVNYEPLVMMTFLGVLEAGFAMTMPQVHRGCTLP